MVERKTIETHRKLVSHSNANQVNLHEKRRNFQLFSSSSSIKCLLRMEKCWSKKMVNFNQMILVPFHLIFVVNSFNYQFVSLINGSWNLFSEEKSKGKIENFFFDFNQIFFDVFSSGVPYASPPVGKLRFMPPVTPAHWNGAKSAHSQGPVCPQNLPNISNTSEALKTMSTGRLRTLKRLIPLLLNQSEDCLYLNIFTPYSGKN